MEQGHDRNATDTAAPLAHVATISFLASRAAPAGGFWLALAGGSALARAGERHGLRRGYGASFAAMLEAIAIMGPARAGVPLTQAASAPLLGRLHARSAGMARQVLICAVIRLLHNAATTAFFIFVIVGGLDAYAGTYDVVLRHLPVLPDGEAGALILTAASLLGWAAFASSVQVAIYRRALTRWPDGAPADQAGSEDDGPEAVGRRFDPRAATAAAAVAFFLLLLDTAWPLLAAVAVWLVVAWVAARGDRDVVPTGLVLAAVLALSVLAFALVGGLGLDVALRRATRAALLVLVATWLRAATGSAGLREVFSRVLQRLRRIPSLSEAAQVLDRLASERRLVAAGRALVASLRSVPTRPLVIVDTVLDWVTGESRRFRPAPRHVHPRLALRVRDGLLVALAAAPVLAVVGG